MGTIKTLSIEDFDDRMLKENDKRLSLLYIYKDGCSRCDNFDPKFTNLFEKYNYEVDFYKMKGNDEIKEMFGSALKGGFPGFPYVILYIGKKNKVNIKHDQSTIEYISYVLSENIASK
jgi:Thioredoxin.